MSNASLLMAQESGRSRKVCGWLSLNVVAGLLVLVNYIDYTCQ